MKLLSAVAAFAIAFAAVWIAGTRWQGRSGPPVHSLSPRPTLPIAAPVAQVAQAPVSSAATAVAAPVAVVREPDADSQSPAPDPQLSPQTAAADLLKRIKAGDFVGYVSHYMPPSVFANMSEDRKASVAEQMEKGVEPGTREYQQMQLMIQALESIQGVAPTFNEAGDRATFQIARPEGSTAGIPSNMEFMLENGKWYLR